MPKVRVRPGVHGSENRARQHVLSWRITTAERDELHARAARLGHRSVGDYLRTVVFPEEQT